MARIYPVIMSGGSGTRLWPLSRRDAPKQYHALGGTRSMLHETIARLDGEIDGHEVMAPTIVCAAGHADTVADLLAEAKIAPHALVLEPMGRNTAPVAVIASALIQRDDPDGLILLLPADHHVAAPDAFRAAIADATGPAMAGFLTTFGIAPTHAETGYGYIQRGESLGPNAAKVATFREKPDRATAEIYLASGDYAWNAGIFLFAARAMRDEAEALAPNLTERALAALAAARTDDQRIYLDRDHFAAIDGDSIDYVIMEKTTHAAMVGPVEMGWNDIGSWQAVRDALGGQHEGTDVIAVESAGCFAHAAGKTVAFVGVKDLVLVATEDAILVVPADRSQDVKKVVEYLKANGPDRLL